MPGPLSAHQGHRTDPGKDPHERCQQRERCDGPGCRVRTGKTHAKHTGATSAKMRAELARMTDEKETEE